MNLDFIKEFKKLSGHDLIDKEIDSYIKQFLYANDSLSANELVTKLEDKIDQDGHSNAKDQILSKLKDIIGLDKPGITEFKTDPAKKDVPTVEMPGKILAESKLIKDVELKKFSNGKLIVKKFKAGTKVKVKQDDKVSDGDKGFLISSDGFQDRFPESKRDSLVESLSDEDEKRIEDITHAIIDIISDKVDNPDDYEWLNYMSVRDMVIDNVSQGLETVEEIVKSIEDTMLGIEEGRDNKSFVRKYKGSLIRVFYDGDTWTWELKGTPNSYGPAEGPNDNDTPEEALQSAKDYIDGFYEFNEAEERTFVAKDQEGNPLFSVSAESDQEARDEIDSQEVDQDDQEKWNKSKQKLDIEESEADEISPEDLEAAGDYYDRNVQYKSDDDIKSEFNNFKITSIEVKPSGDSGYINIEFPEGGEHVGGGTDEVSDSWIIYDNGRVAFDNWYPEEVYNELVDAIHQKKLGLREDADQKFEYQLLSRLQQDCKYSIQNNSLRHLWGITVEDHIAKMRELYDQLKEKPEWISEQDIDSYEEQLKAIDNGVNEDDDETDFTEFEPDTEDNADMQDTLDHQVNYDKDRIKVGDMVEITDKSSGDLVVAPTKVIDVQVLKDPAGEEYITVDLDDGNDDYIYSEEDYDIKKYEQDFKEKEAIKDLLNQSYDGYIEKPKQVKLSESLKDIKRLSTYRSI